MVVNITNVFATAQCVILCLSARITNSNERKNIWKNPSNYELRRVIAGGTEVPIALNDTHVTYTEEIPAVIILATNTEGDRLLLTCKNPEEAFDILVVARSSPANPDESPIEETPTPDEGQPPIEETPTPDEGQPPVEETPIPDEMEWIKDKLTNIDEVVLDVQARVTTLETSAIPGITDLLNQILDRVNTVPGEIGAIEDRMEAAEQEISVLKDTEIPRIDGLILRLEGSRPADSSVLQALEDQLKESKVNLSASLAQGEALVDEVFNHWQENLTAFEDAMRNPDIQPKVKAKIQELRSYIGWKISEISVLRVPIANNPVVGARVGRLKSNTITNLNEVLGSIGYLKRSQTVNGIGGIRP